jgi:hypothetical protein
MLQPLFLKLGVFMANSLTTNPWVLDTPGATILYVTDIKVRHFEWSGYAASATCAVQDRFGKVIWNPIFATDLEEVRSAAVGWVHGIAMVTLTSGQVRVYFE